MYGILQSVWRIRRSTDFARPREVEDQYSYELIAASPRLSIPELLAPRPSTRNPPETHSKSEGATTNPANPHEYSESPVSFPVSIPAALRRSHRRGHLPFLSG